MKGRPKWVIWCLSTVNSDHRAKEHRGGCTHLRPGEGGGAHGGAEGGGGAAGGEAEGLQGGGEEEREEGEQEEQQHHRVSVKITTEESWTLVFKKQLKIEVEPRGGRLR